MKFTACTIFVALCILLFYSATVNAASGSASGSIGSKNAIAKVIKVTPSIDNEWIVAVTDSKSPTGYAVQVKDYLYKGFVKPYFIVFMFTRTSPQDKLKDFFAGGICDLLQRDQDYYPKKNYMPRQILNLILPGRYGSCDLENSTVPIKASGTVNTDPKHNKLVTFPESSPFELVVNILSRRYIDTPEKDYFFQVVFAVGGNLQASGSIGGSTSGKKGASGGGQAKVG